MTNPRSAANAWSKVRNKLNSSTDDAASSKASPKKKTVKKDGEGGEDTPKKTGTPRKRAAKKQEVDNADASPKKKGRGAKVKKSSDDESCRPTSTHLSLDLILTRHSRNQGRGEEGRRQDRTQRQ